jgi:plasmid maintenance system antidote protein VapI
MTEIVETKITIHNIDLKKLFKGKSVKKICKLAGVDYNNVNRAKNGYNRISLETWEKLKKVLDINNKF